MAMNSIVITIISTINTIAILSFAITMLWVYFLDILDYNQRQKILKDLLEVNRMKMNKY